MCLVLFIYILEILGGIFIANVEIIFNFAAAIAASSLAFIFPGAMFITLEKRYQLDEFAKLPNKLFYIRVSAYVFIVVGIISFLVLLANNIVEIV